MSLVASGKQVNLISTMKISLRFSQNLRMSFMRSTVKIPTSRMQNTCSKVFLNSANANIPRKNYEKTNGGVIFRTYFRKHLGAINEPKEVP